MYILNCREIISLSLTCDLMRKKVYTLIMQTRNKVNPFKTLYSDIMYGKHEGRKLVESLGNATTFHVVQSSKPDV